MVANQRPGFQRRIDFFSFGEFSDITNLTFWQNFVWSCQALELLSKYSLGYCCPFDSFRAYPIQHGDAHLERKR